ncbi:hypothetical protein PHPALM_30918 [Phytophthora palmivora]|uniref:Uncharacterized protein n=1 Tax=Phytophthora palmivora TaxID=4796 RepID=A0A2P4X3Y1_9STRA|nr:hypothetical protein PHPALM_30918 [Phytophthora palmivora]
MTKTSMAFAYFANAACEDRGVARILSGWDADASPNVIDIAAQNHTTRERLRCSQELLFKWSLEASDTEGDEVDIGDDEGSASDSEGESLKTQPAADSNAGQRQNGNAYVDGLIRDSGLHIVRENEVKAPTKSEGS